MLTLRAAAQLLARTDSVEAMHSIASALGFPAQPLPLPPSSQRDIGVPVSCDAAALASAPGGLTLFCATLAAPGTLSDTGDIRQQAHRIGTALLRQAPTRLWCLCLLDQSRNTLCIAVAAPHARGTRLTALRVERHRVLDSDADTMRALSAVTESDALTRHARFADILGRDALSSRFYRELEQRVSALADSLHAPSTGRQALITLSSRERRELALLCASRCLFLSFLEAKGWMNGEREFLLRHAIQALERGGRIHTRTLRPLFFGTLNTPRAQRAPDARRFGAIPFLNGGLFTPTPLERRAHRLDFGDDALTSLIGGLLDRYRFTAREDSHAWSEAAVDPEMLGRAFEGLMADDERRRSGSFYTPPHLVAHAVDAALASAFASCSDQPSVAQIERLRILDPACGSGAFLVHTLEELDARCAIAGDDRPAHLRRRSILTRCIFGVDKQPMAVWLCELRLWLSVVIEYNTQDIDSISPLPNLDHHIRVGDALTGGTLQFAPPGSAHLSRLRERYARSTGRRKHTVAQTLDHEERQRALAEHARRLDALRRERRLLLTALRGRDLFGNRRKPARADTARLEQLRQHSRDLQSQRNRLRAGGALPFRFASMFADIAATGGFDLLIGNPPWVRPHAMVATEREWLRTEFRTMRRAAWHAGATRAGAGTGFAAQADLAVAFVERAVQLLAPGGTLSLLVPSKLWRTLAGGGIRSFLHHETHIRAVHDWSDAPAQFDAATYPSLLVAQRRSPRSARNDSSHISPQVHCTVVRRKTEHFAIPAHSLTLEPDDPAAPWILLPPAARAAFDALRHAGPSLATSALGRPTLGVKCGCNAAFLVHAIEHQDAGATITSLAASMPMQGVVERTMLRPALRGESLSRTRNDRESRTAFPAPDERDEQHVRIIWTHDTNGLPLKALPPATTRWLAQWRSRLQTRRDARAKQPWWTLFRTEAARNDLPRLVWADIGRTLHVRVLPAHDPTIPLNTCYVLRLSTIDDAFAAQALLSSTIAAAWLDAIAEPARGGFRRFLGWTVSSLPTPADWPRAVCLLAPIGRRLALGDPVPAPLLDAAVAQCFGLSLSVLSPLIAWYRHASAKAR
ncbi:MAG: N-6 DNA methylase [Gemmatimonadaceae bacterium]|nr:N-6 DNA methylase [Gemmatimonadaceae bacterium]